MTKLTGDKTVIRETAAIYRRRPLCFKATAYGLVLWELGRRGEKKYFDIDYESIYEAAMKLKVLREEAEGKTRRKRRKHHGRTR